MNCKVFFLDITHLKDRTRHIEKNIEINKEIKNSLSNFHKYIQKNKLYSNLKLARIPPSTGDLCFRHDVVCDPQKTANGTLTWNGP